MVRSKLACRDTACTSPRACTQHPKASMDMSGKAQLTHITSAI